MQPEPDCRAPEPVSVARTLSTLAEQSTRCTADCCGAVTTLMHSGPQTASAAGAADAERRTAATHPDLATLASVQLDRGEGPIPTALERGEPVDAADLLADDRWPEFRALAIDSGVRASLTLPFCRAGIEVTLSLYSFRPGGLAAVEHGAAVILGEQATAGLVRERRFHEALTEVGQLSHALRSRPVIDRASGIVMHVLGCDESEAFAFLKKVSQQTNRKLVDVAERVVGSRGRALHG
ncbi:ANTAR domain-containing response regulator [Streptomyces sp. NPDC004111]|uniref:ANTAR domain-containing response regulator n=1 Tax=Streptomyces sp. NPDC004111 TaxID=3364690 RepID=UPI00369A16E1